MKLDSVVPFGRTLAEYRLMFNLTDADLQCQIFDIAAEPASFTTEIYCLGYQVTAINPIYKFSGTEIKQRFNDCVDQIIGQVENTSQDCQTVTKLLQHTHELRIFPLLTLMFDRSPYLDRLCEYLKKSGYQTQIIPVEYELQPGGNAENL